MELPLVQKIYEDLKKPEELQIVAVEINEDREGSEKFIKENGLTFIFAEANRKFVESNFNTAGYPNTFLIGKDSRIRQHHRGFRSGQEEQLQQEIVEELKKK